MLLQEQLVFNNSVLLCVCNLCNGLVKMLLVIVQVLFSGQAVTGNIFRDKQHSSFRPYRDILWEILPLEVIQQLDYKFRVKKCQE